MDYFILTNVHFFLDKYSIKEILPPKEAAVIVAEKKIKPFKYIKVSLLKFVHKRMSCFIKLVDLIVMNMLHTLVMNGVKVLQKQVEASFNCSIQPFLAGISQHVDKMLGVYDGKETMPLFETSLVLWLGNIYL